MQILFRIIGLLGLTLALTHPANAVNIDITYVGTWDSISSGNNTSGGPGLFAGQKYVIRITYDDLSTTTDNVDVLTAFFTPSGNTMSTIDLTNAGNSLDLFVPMEGLDTGSPFIYYQNETDHFPAFIPSPTLNFVNGSDISDTSNIIGLEFEGNFMPGANSNVIELFNTAPSGGSVNMVSQILNLGTGPAATDTNGLASAVGLKIDAGPNLVYDATTLVQTTSSAVIQSNDLGAARADGEDFIDAAWSQTGASSGNNDISVGVVDSGLTNTVDTATWTAMMVEQMTLQSDVDSLVVSYLNALPTASASATATATGTDFTLSFDDMDLLVNAFIAGFESLTVTALVNGAIDSTAFFTDLISLGSQSYTDAVLEAAFGIGTHNVAFFVTDFAGATTSASANFSVSETLDTVPEPGTLALLLLGLMAFSAAKRRSSIIVRPN
jgi:PEP-CTERM motif-containing protein